MSRRAPLWKLRRHLIGRGDLTCLRRLFPGNAELDRSAAESLVTELRELDELEAALDSTAGRAWTGGPVAATGPRSFEAQLRLDSTGRSRAVLLYAATRLARPKVAIEIGCFSGWDTSFILAALRRNGAGHLFTIDLPAREGQFSQLPGHRSSLPAGLGPGFLVPDAWRDRWTLLLGNARYELPPLLEDVGEVGLVYRDSHHTYEHMMWEFTTVWPYLADGGVLVADDISWNTAFRDFADGVGARMVVHRSYANVGALRAPAGRLRLGRAVPAYAAPKEPARPNAAVGSL